MLTIYRASAGAGKTHKLTGEYLKLAFASLGAFRHILAVTFTNKATEEMKGRIVDELYHLASDEKSDYVEILKETYSLTEDLVREKASAILKEILHDYSSFNISTIDKFFQQTMRAFTREIGLQGGYGIEMDKDLVLDTVIDNMLGSLSKPENKQLLEWLVKFSEDKIESGSSWDLRKDIRQLSNEIFKETYKESGDLIASETQDKSSLDNFKKELILIIKSTESTLKSLGEKGQKILSEHWLEPTDISGASRSPLLWFAKWAEGNMKEPSVTFQNLEDNLEKYFTKTTPAEKRVLIETAYNEGLNDCVKEINHFFEDLTIYNSAKEVIRYYYTLGILTDISSQLSEYREEKNIMLISDTTELLNKVIDGSSTPFIYEKIGTRVEHYMIDEFQDTSAMQWANFRPLIEESLSREAENLIVGDVKQSIYRFRNSDWRLLDEKISREFSPAELAEETLKDNWRSCANIVGFNNALFTITPILLQQKYNADLEVSSLSSEEQEEYSVKILGAYDRSYQRIPPTFQNRPGHVRIEFIEDTDTTNWQEEALGRLPGVIEQLQDNGYPLKDIAILVRTNKEGGMVADKMLAYAEEHRENGYKYDIISDEALFISNAQSIRFLIAILRYLQNTTDIRSKSLALYSFQVLKGEFGSLEPSFGDDIEHGLKELSRQSLYETTESLCRLFADVIPSDEQVYIQAFLDMVTEYSQKESSDLNSFLTWWDESGCAKTIATPDGQDAVRILTVHKSKGLGFKAVIMPFGNWEIDHKAQKNIILWCNPKLSPFNQFHLLPVKYSGTLKGTVFAEDYFKERLFAFVDNLNTLYVALTRAKEEMIIFSPYPKKLNKTGMSEKIDSIGDLLWNSLKTEMNQTREGIDLMKLPIAFDGENGIFELGDWWHAEVKEKEETIKEIPMSNITSVSPNDRLQLRLQGKNFCFDDVQRKYGNLMHEILSSIRTIRDIDKSIEHYRLIGLIDRREADELNNRLTVILRDEKVMDWFEEDAVILNEVDILGGKNFLKRPDRVIIKDGKVTVIDYKFGLHEKKIYSKQIKEYIQLIRKMGYKDVTGYIWYVELDKIEPVSSF